MPYYPHMIKQLKAREEISPKDFEKCDRVKFTNGDRGTVTSTGYHHVYVKFDDHHSSVPVCAWNLQKIEATAA